MKYSNKFYVVFKNQEFFEGSWWDDDHFMREKMVKCKTQVLAICDNPKRALKILEDEMAHCKKQPDSKQNPCYLFVKVFDNINQVNKKNEKQFSIFQFKKMVDAFI